MTSFTDNATAAQPKTGLLSLPDEVLQHIVGLLAGKIRFLMADYCAPDRFETHHLRCLRLVNKRLSSIVDSTMYRVPNALARTRGFLSGDDLDILLHPKVVHSARVLGLAGSALFCAGLLDSRFCHLTSVTFILGIAEFGTQGSRNEPFPRLRKVLQALPLRELYISFEEGVVTDEKHLFQLALLGAAHPSLRNFSIWGDLDARLTRLAHCDNFPIQPTTYTSPIESLAVSDLTTDHAQVVRNALGCLPHLVKLDIDVGNIGSGDCAIAEILNILASGLKHRILRLRLCATAIGPRTWQALGDLPALESLDFGATETFGEMRFPDVCLPKLARIQTYNFTSINTVLFHKALDRHLLPALQNVNVYLGDLGVLDYGPRHAEQIQAMVAAHDKLVEVRKDVKVTPQYFRELAVEYMRALEADESSMQGF
jgi:hypothetical protein